MHRFLPRASAHRARANRFPWVAQGKAQGASTPPRLGHPAPPSSSWLTAAVAGVALLASAPASAAEQVVAQIRIDLEVRADCNFASGGLGIGSAVIDFGSTAASDGTPIENAPSGTDTSGVNVTCSADVSSDATPNVAIDAGLHGEGGQRYLIGPNGARVAYALYRDRARTIPYDPRVPLPMVLNGSGVPTPVGIYGRVLRSAGLPEGHYSDSVTLTLSY